MRLIPPRITPTWVVCALLLLPFVRAFAADVPAGETATRLLTGHSGEVFTLTYSPDGAWLASAGGDQTIRLWEPATGRELKVLRGHMGPVRALRFSPDSRILASGSADTTIRLWDLASGKESRSLNARFGTIHSLAFSPDARLLASGGSDGSIRLWDLAAGKEIKAMRRHFGIIFSVAFSPDGQTLATGGSDTHVHLWDVATGLIRQTLSAHSGAIQGVAFSPDGSLVASGSSDGTVRLWDVATGQERSLFSGHTGEVQTVAFNADGRTLASAGTDSTVRIWDVATGQERASLTGHKGPVWSLAFSPDGTVIASGGRDRIVRVQPPASPVLSASLAEKIKRHGNEIGQAPSPPPLPAAELSIQPLEAKAGATVTLQLKVRNTGKGPLYRFQAKTKSADQALDGHVFYVGKVEGGKSAEDTVTVTIPQDRTDGQLPLRIEFEEYNGFVPDPIKAVIALKGIPRPRFAFTYQIVDDGSGNSVGNGDGRIQKGEAVDLLLTVKNVGSVPAQHTTAELTTSLASGFRIRDGEVQFGVVKQDETKTARINLHVSKAVTQKELPLKLFIRERGQNVMLEEGISLALDHRPPPDITVTNKLVSVAQASVKIHSGAGTDTSVIASAAKDQSLAVTGELGEWYRVQLSPAEAPKPGDTPKPGDIGWVAKRQVMELDVQAKAEMPIRAIESAPVVKLFQKAPPVIAVASPADGQQTNTDRLHLIGAAASDKGIARVEIWVNGLLAGQREGSRGIAVKPSEESVPSNLEFGERIILKEGRNEIVVTAVDRDNQSSTRKLTVTRVTDKGKIWAVVIGISQYKSVRALQYADKDASAFHDYLLTYVGIPKEQMTLLTNEQATLSALKRTLGTDLKRKAGEKDTVIIYYAGHGAPESEASATDDDGLEKYIVPYDADPNDLYTTGLPMREVETIFQRLSPERVIFITDSCYSGATAGRTFQTASRRAVVSEAFLSRLSKGKGRVVLTASRASEVSEERDNLGHGVFTYYLLEGLKGKADQDGDGIVTVDEVYAYVSKAVPEATGQNQHPVKKGEVEGQLVLGRTR
jgi:uncharacterized caspase-like protein/Tol biopolymer transport system component